MVTLTKDGFLTLRTYGRGVRLNPKIVTVVYSALAVAVPVVVPLWLAPIIYRYCPVAVRWS